MMTEFDTPISAFRRVGRNDPCPCGSGLKFKKCCQGKRQKAKELLKTIHRDQLIREITSMGEQ